MVIKTDIAIIVNPIAGSRKDKNIIANIGHFLDHSWNPVFLMTEKKGHATQLVMKYLKKGVKHFIAVGGDGTVNEVAGCLIGKKAILGIVPCGSGNGLARSLGIPLTVKGSVTFINKRNTLKIDAGIVDNRYFFCTCGTGFDARIGKKFDKHPRRGFITYIKVTLREYFNYSAKRYSVKIDGSKVKRRAFLLTIANAGQYGNNAFIAPQANIRDGWLDICFLKPFPLYKSLSLGLRLFTGKIAQSKYYETFKGKEITIKKKKLQFHLDGEPVKFKGPLTITVLKRELKVFAEI